MKRRNVDVSKIRRPMKKGKITEGIYESTMLYLKFIFLWTLVILADYIMEFRFEFLWPFYLLLRSVYDSFKYQGLAFSIFFVCIALTSDMLCFFFIPVHWLFFVASTYVWVHYVWQTDKGFCMPTLLLWILFVYMETAIRTRDVKQIPNNLHICRPFAANCIGYPVVSLGVGFKSYVGVRMRLRKQRDVAKENEFYMQLIQQALPPDLQQQQNDVCNNLSVHTQQNVLSTTNVVQNTKMHNVSNNKQEKNGHLSNGIANGQTKSHRKAVDKCKDQHNDDNSNKVNQSHINGNVISSIIDENQQHNHQQQQQLQVQQSQQQETKANKRQEKKKQDKEREAAEYLQKVESDAKRLRIELQNSRASEQELRLQVATLTTSEKVSKGELTAMQRELEDVQQRLQNVIAARLCDKQTISNLERRNAEERRTRTNLETQLNQERKCRKEEARLAAQVAAQTNRGECTEICKSRKRDIEMELQECRQATNIALERCNILEREKNQLAEKVRDTDLLMNALSALQEKNAHLENSLSAETRIKLDLFSALGEAKRQIEIKESSNRNQEKEIEELKSKIAQVLAVMPNDSFGGAAQMSRVRLGGESPPGSSSSSTLDPNATAYTPKGSLVASTEA